MADAARRPDARWRVPVAVFVTALAALSLQRVLLGALLSERFAGTSLAEWAGALWIGLRYDLNIACTLTLPALLLTSVAPRRAFDWRPIRGLAVLALALVGAAVLALVFVDAFFFTEYGERLNHKAIDYLGDRATWGMLYQDFPLVTTCVVIVVGFLGLRRLYGRACFPADRQAAPIWRGALRLVLVLPLVLLGIRGTTGQKALNTSLAYASDSAALAQWSLNGGFTLREALLSRFGRGIPLEELFSPLPDDEALSLAAEALRRPEDTDLGDPDNPLRRRTDTGRPAARHNVVLVIMEGLSWHYVEAMGGELGLTPRFDALIGDGLLFERCFAVGSRTSRGLAGILSGFPDLPGTSVTKRIESEGALMTLAGLLRGRGYRTLFVHGGEATYDHMQGFALTNGYERTVFADQFDEATFRNAYGLCDGDLFAQSLRELDALHAQDADTPFLATLLTLSFHRPYQVPEGVGPRYPAPRRNREQLDCVMYADHVLGEFVDRASERPWFDDTLFVFVADHAGGFHDKPVTPGTFRVPFLVYAPALLPDPGRRCDTVCSQTDVPPTVLSLLGGAYEHAFFGSSVLDRPREAGLALLQRNDLLALVDGSGDVVELYPGKAPLLYRYELPNELAPVLPGLPGARERAAELQRRAQALLQSAARVFERGAYRPGGARSGEVVGSAEVAGG